MKIVFEGHPKSLEFFPRFEGNRLLVFSKEPVLCPFFLPFSPLLSPEARVWAGSMGQGWAARCQGVTGGGERLQIWMHSEIKLPYEPQLFDFFFLLSQKSTLLFPLHDPYLPSSGCSNHTPCAAHSKCFARVRCPGRALLLPLAVAGSHVWSGSEYGNAEIWDQCSHFQLSRRGGAGAFPTLLQEEAVLANLVLQRGYLFRQYFSSASWWEGGSILSFKCASMCLLQPAVTSLILLFFFFAFSFVFTKIANFLLVVLC